MWCRSVRQKKLGQEILVRHGLVAFHSTLESLHEPLSEAVSGRMVWCLTDMADSVGSCELLKFLRCKLRTVVRD